MLRRPTTRAANSQPNEDPRPSIAGNAEKRTGAPANTALGTRKRAALGDVTNNTRLPVSSKVGPSKGVPALDKPSKATVPRKAVKSSTTESAHNQAPSVTSGLSSKSSVAQRPRSTVSTRDSAVPSKSRVTTSRVTNTKSKTNSNAAPGKRVVHVDRQAAAEAVEEESSKPAKRPRTTAEAQQVARASSKPAQDEVVETWEDLDAGEEDDPLMVSTYVVEVYDYLFKLEQNSMADPSYMERQDKITWSMRGVLMDWLIEVHVKFRLLPETIFLAANIVDRFLSIRAVSVEKFQLVGVAALFIASKYEEVVCPSVSNFLFMTEDGYSEDEFIKAERYMLQMIQFDLSYPNPINFLRRISKADAYDVQTRTLAKYFMEITVVDHHFLGVPPSMIAAASMWLSRLALNKGKWNATLQHYSSYTEEEIIPNAQLMVDYILQHIHDPEGSSKDPQHPHLHRKYATRKFYKASEFARIWAESNLTDDGEILSL